jgi:hypothetical protein
MNVCFGGEVHASVGGLVGLEEQTRIARDKKSNMAETSIHRIHDSMSRQQIDGLEDSLHYSPSK